MSGHKLVSFAPRAGHGALLGLVPAGAVADAVVALVDGRLVAVPVIDNRRPVQNLGSLPLADITVDDVAVLAEGTEARRLFSDALDLWLALTAAALAGAAKKAVDIGVEYAKQRHAFGDGDRNLPSRLTSARRQRDRSRRSPATGTQGGVRVRR